MGRSLHAKLKAVYAEWKETKDDGALLETMTGLADQFGKQRSAEASSKRLLR